MKALLVSALLSMSGDPNVVRVVENAPVRVDVTADQRLDVVMRPRGDVAERCADYGGSLRRSSTGLIVCVDVDF